MRAAVLATIVALGVGSSACATKKFVRTQVGEVNSKVETLSTSLEETQQRTKENEQKISQVDVKVGQVDAKTDQVGVWAKDAQTAAGAAQTSANQAGKGVDAANQKIAEVDKQAKRLLYEVVLSEDQGSFKFGNAELPDPAKMRIDQLIGQLKADPRGAYIEVEGYTDNVGSKEVNNKVGLERAEAVKRYLYETHQVPLHKINVISYGEDKPAAPNNTRAGRAQNRRVVIKVLA
jgi:peptidoglycan-associated lipoprotein